MSELFLSIFNTAMTAGWLVLAVLVARLLLKNAPGWAKCALWAIVGLRLIWPFELESILSLVPSAQTLPPAELYDYTPEIHTGIYVVNATINPVFTEAFLSGPMNSVNPLQVVVMVSSVLWGVGMVAMAGYALISYLRLRRRVAVSIPVGEGVYLCDAITSPFILGLVKPKIDLPSDLPQEQWDAILSHERAHLARRDHWWKPLGFALLTVFWFHPLLWVAYVLLCRDVELACDEKVIKDLSPEEKQSYSQILLECSMPRKWITACPLAFGETSVKQRIKAVLHYKKPTLWIIIAALVICSVLAVCFLTDPMDDQNQPWVATSEAISNKQYVYTKPGAGSAFYINIYSDGTFQYYAGVYSSHIGMGDWELKDGKLYLYDTMLTNPMTFVFSVYENSLAYIAAESHPFMYVQVANGEVFALSGEIGKQKINLVWVNASDIQNDHFSARDNEGNQWRIWMTNDMTRCDLDHAYDGIWVQYYGAAHELSEKDATIQYEVTALACWRYVTNTAVSNEHYQWPCYDYCRYDVDNDGHVEECIISMGHTSGLFTIHYSVWQDGECEEEKLLYTNHALGFAFDTDENGLFILSSEGDRIYPGFYSNGIRH